MRAPLSALILVAAWLSACGGSAPEIPVPDLAALRSTDAGDVIGFTDAEGGHTWLGIPFAQPPIDELRWRAPRRVEPWPETREALAFGPACVQIAGPAGAEGPAGEPAGNEDCLTLNVYAPRFEQGEIPDGLLALPVMLWIHGGGNSQGHAALYDGSALAGERRVVVVSFQYRLGGFGWFRHPALHAADASPEDRSGNYGTLDAIAALEWVRDNIAAFGGDPNRVTIFGESAGGENVLALLRSPRAEGLFHGAISQSGWASGKTLAQAENYEDAAEPGDEASSNEILLRLLEREGRAENRAAGKALVASMTNQSIAELLRGVPAPDFLRLFTQGELGAMYENPRLLRDGVVLSRLGPLEAYRSGDYNRVPTILGSNRDEVRTFLLFTSQHVRHLMRIPIGMRNQRMYEATADSGSRAWKAMGVDEPAAAMREMQGPSVYGYRFDWDHAPGVLWLDLARWLGAGHALEIPFVFGRLSLGVVTPLIFDPDRAELDEALSHAMTSYWTQFAYTGDPGVGREGDLVRWEPWDAHRGSFLILDTTDDAGIHMSGDTVTLASVVADVARDPRLETQLERCEVYRDMARGGAVLSAADYAQREGGACNELLPPPLRY